MASYQCSQSVHATLEASVVDGVTLDDDVETIEVLNHDASNDLYFTVASLVPTVMGANTYCVLPGGARTLSVANIADPTVVQVISVAGVTYSITSQ